MEIARRPRRNAAQTKDRILVAAQQAFSHAGYARAGLREIAAEAGVTSSLVVRYFASKSGLFEAALIWTIDRYSFFSWEKDGFGEAMTRLLVEKDSIDIAVMLVLGLADPEAQAVVNRVSRTHMLSPLVTWLGPPHAVERAESLFALLTGYVIRGRGIGEREISPAAASWLAGILQAIVDEGTDRQENAKISHANNMETFDPVLPET
jgi:AcrR family transcriptional regulator